jgi:hypothetical protein
VRLAYADPPYFGLAEKFYGDKHPEAAEYDKLETHARLIERLSDEYDGWAMSLGTAQLHPILPLCPSDVRIGAWVKSWCSYKKNVMFAYAWEPVIFRGGRKGKAGELTVRDWFEYPATQRKGFQGAKPEAVLWWIFRALRAQPGDEFTDMFPGSGAAGRAWDHFIAQGSFPLVEATA